MKKYLILFIFLLLKGTVFPQAESSSIYKTEIDSLLRDSVLISNILQDLYSNTEIADSLYINKTRQDSLIVKELSIQEELISQFNQKDSLYKSEIILVKDQLSVSSKQVNKLKKQNVVSTIFFGISLIVLILIVI